VWCPPVRASTPGQRIALQPAAGLSAYACSPVPHRALLTAWAALNNDGDSVVLEAPDGTELDRVAYPRDAFAVEGPSLRLDPSSGRWTASPRAATACGLPAPRPGMLRLPASRVVVDERAGTVAVEVRRGDGTNGRVAVRWSTFDGSAGAGSDYVRSAGTVALAAGQQTATISIPLIDDSRDEVDEAFTTELSAPEGGAALAEPPRATVVIRDDDAPAPGTTQPTPVLPPVAPAPEPPAPVFPPAPAAVPKPPSATLAVAAWQPVLHRGGLTAIVRCDHACTVRTAGRIGIGDGRSIPLAATTRTLTANAAAVTLLRVPLRHARALRRALSRRGSLLATVAATPAGGARVERRVRLR
jgi:hypothetical protein